MSDTAFGHDWDATTWRCRNCGRTIGTVGAMRQCATIDQSSIGDRSSDTEPSAEIDFAAITAGLSRG